MFWFDVEDRNSYYNLLIKLKLTRCDAKYSYITGVCMKVKNLNGTSSNTCKCKSWLKHWVNYNSSGDTQLPSYCGEESCTNEPEVGAHVQKDSQTDSSWYILPLCKSHNNKRGETLNKYSGVSLAPANVSNTCG